MGYLLAVGSKSVSCFKSFVPITTMIKYVDTIIMAITMMAAMTITRLGEPALCTFREGRMGWGESF